MRTRINPKPILLAALQGERIPPGRYMDITYCRFIMARHLRLQHKNQEQIGAAMGRNHSTIAYYLCKYDIEYKHNHEFLELADWFNQMKEQL